MNRFFAALIALVFAVPATAQTNINLGGIAADPSAPVEVTADNLNVDQDTGSAVFSGNVVIGQGDLRLSAPSVQVTYAADSGDITRLQATGGVTFATATEAAEAQSADYNLASGLLTLNGDVLLTQGQSALSADSMVLDLNAGTAQMNGRVRTVFQQDGNN
ncbi:lipopolysaccharide transport periplasmic protein LptA [Loktanella salsilacus]|uniref:lipopolysaccharide transport periplasmic protein LptA n=1 Tax=Loktanella salsilacus TaxID=195913 RepID=UPI001ED599FC|nr:lipopolysaccharide transport periplasmic protein LptA [Loktanella salsilacus]MBU0782206.1 lipopolysaccharide transport periplasmic protein LptA [Alphaproteobacteria bacterium]MBU0861772.1 lipopolysaccharide transport periplasmic protein LptA [Alphaproteobacteria bacterium]UTH48056.1 lipopolysaccharide transport periplasmic protein LptA [Loktanella salsilacus]